MKWYWRRSGGHTHVRVFMNGTRRGNLCFRNEEFDGIRAALVVNNKWLIELIEEPICTTNWKS